MRWQSVVRLIIAGLGLAVAALVYTQWSARPVEEALSTDAPLSDPTAISVSDDGVFELLTADGTPAMSIQYKEKKDFSDGRMEFAGVSATFVRAGVRQTMQADRAVTSGKMGPTGLQPTQVDFSGHVKLSSEEGFLVEADEDATFYNDEQKTVIPGPMRFTRGRLSGSGVGAELFMDRSVLWINSQAKLTVAPEVAGGVPVDATATRIGLADADHFMVLEGEAVMQHQGKRLSSDHARVSFTPVGNIVQYIEMRGRSAVRTTGGTGGRALTAANINLAFAPDTGLLTHAQLAESAVVAFTDAGRITRVSGSTIELHVGADGETLTRLDATDPVEVQLPRESTQRPQTTIRAQTLLAEGADGKGLQRALFSGAVRYQEARPSQQGKAAETRTATAGTLSLDLKGDLGQVESARFKENFRVTDGPLTASAAEGVYNSGAETLLLRGAAGSPRPKATTTEMDVVADEIDTDLARDAFDARGRVESALTPATTTTTKTDTGGGLFQRGTVVTGSSNRLQYSRTTGRAEYDGAVFLVQGDSRLGAERVVVEDATGNLTATGKVSSRFALESASGRGAAPAKPTDMRADELVYTDAARTAVYSGAAQLDTATGEQITAARITLTLAEAARTLKTAVATAAAGGTVLVRLLEGRQASGASVTYDAATEEYRVQGAPATLVVPVPDRAGECNVSSGTLLRFFRTQGASSMDSVGGAVGQQRPVKCAEVIK
jgi:lipopolysaccharide export system protein LptA